MAFEELDGTTRTFMVARFDAEEASGNPYRSAQLSHEGRVVYSGIARAAMKDGDGNEERLAAALSVPEYWKPYYTRRRSTGPAQVTINPVAAAQRLALTEFNTWYVAGLADRLLAEGETECEVYRAAEPLHERAKCSDYEGERFPLDVVVAGHRARYWPEPGDPNAFSVPNAFNCHHTIRRIGQ